MMGAAVMFAEIDRTAMQYLVKPIKDVYHLNDTMIGLLLGPAFALFYAFCGVPTSRFIDRFNRKNILAGALALWSAGSVFCGLAQNYWQLIAARLFLGVVESPNAPAIFSIIADSFPRSRLTRGISLMQLGTTFGNGFSLVMTGLLIVVLSQIPDQHVGGLVIRWWQLVFIAIGLPGILLAPILFKTVKEPQRHGEATQAKVGILEVLRYMAGKWKIFGAFMGSQAIAGLSFGVITWNAEFFRRTYHWAPAKIAMLQGAVSIVATLLGLWLGTLLYERFVKQGRHDAAMRVVLIGQLISLPIGLLYPLAPTGEIALALSGFNFLMLGATGASLNAVLQIISPNRMRAQTTAIFFLFYNLIGQGLSPLLIGMATDLLLKDESQLRYAILGAVVLFRPASLFVLWLGRKAYAEEVERLESAEAPAAA